jgi:hypothetical protein
LILQPLRLFLFQEIDAGIKGDLHQPSGKLGIEFKIPEAYIGFDKHFLTQIFPVRFIKDHPENGMRHQILIAVDKDSVGFFITGNYPLN